MIICNNLIVAHCYSYIYASDFTGFFDFVYIISSIVIYLLFLFVFLFVFEFQPQVFVCNI